MNLPEVLSVVGLFTGVQFPRNVNRCLKFCCDRRVRRMRIRLYSQDLLSDKYVVTVLCLLAWSCCCFCWNPGKGKHVQIDCLGHRCVLCVFSERELMFMFAICRRPSVCRLSVCRLSVTFVHPTQAIEIFGNVSTPFGTLAICDPSVKILRRSSQGNPSVGGVKPKSAGKM